MNTNIFSVVALVLAFEVTACRRESVQVAPSLKEEAIIHGVALDNFGKPVSGAAVQVTGMDFKTTTDKNGSYRISYLPGQVNIEFTKQGYFNTQLILNLATKENVPAKQIVLNAIPPAEVPSVMTAKEFIRMGVSKVHRESKSTAIFEYDHTFSIDVKQETSTLVMSLDNHTFTVVDQLHTPSRLFIMGQDGVFLRRKASPGADKDTGFVVLPKEAKQIGSYIYRTFKLPMVSEAYAALIQDDAVSSVSDNGERAYFFALDIDEESKRAIKCLSNAKSISIACLAYADNHEGNYPKNLLELVPDYISDKSIFNSPFSPKPDEMGYEYFPGFKMSDPDPENKILLRGRYTTKDGKRSVVRLDSRGATERQ